MNNDPLEEIFTSEKQLDPEVLASILKPFVKINVETNSVFFTDAGSSLSLNYQLLLFLIARKALKFKEKIEVEEISPSEIIIETGFKAGSVHPGLKQLREQKWVISKGGKYFVANHQLVKIKKLFESKEKNA